MVDGGSCDLGFVVVVVVRLHVVEPGVLVVLVCLLLVLVAGGLVGAVAVQHQGQVQVGDGHHALVGGVEGSTFEKVYNICINQCTIGKL